MTITIKRLVAALCLLSLSPFASAGMISFSMNPAFGTVNGSILVDIVWTGQGDYTGAFDVDVVDDAWIAEIVGDSAFDPPGGLGIAFFDEGLYCPGCSAGGGAYRVLGLSLDSVADLINAQDPLGNSFVLATFEFVGVANGQTPVSLGFC